MISARQFASRLGCRSRCSAYDAQYTKEEYERKAGWGHSSVHSTVAFAEIAEVERLVLFHHDPGHSDGDIDSLADVARHLAGDSMQAPAAAYEQMEIRLG